jgi:competence protein ComEA
MPDQGNDKLPDDRQAAESPELGRPLLARGEQALIGGVILAALLLMAGSWWRHQSRQHGLIEIERAPRRHAAFQVDINHAGWAELAQLPGVGETIARRIVESRTTDGQFVSLDDLQRINGIGPRTMERLRPYLLPLAESDTVAEGLSEAQKTNDEGS